MYTIDADIWQDQRLLVAPRTSLVRWQVIEVSAGSCEHYFFIGHCPSLRQSTVSDFIISFNPFLGLGLGKFGMIYQLEGEPGVDRKANDMLRKMLQAMPGSEHQDLTDEWQKDMVKAAVLARETSTSRRNFFGVSVSGIDPSVLQSKLFVILGSHKISQPDLIASRLFANLHRSTDTIPAPFPLITSARLANSHAKTLHKELKGLPNVSLVRSMGLFAELWGYRSWDVFKKDVEVHFSKTKIENIL